MPELVRRRPALGAGALIVLNLLLLSLQVRDAEGRVLLRTWGLALLTPVAVTAHLVSSSVESLLERYVFLLGAEEENRRLRRENARLTVELRTFQGLQALLERQQRLELVASGLFFKTIPAAVVWRSPTLYSNRSLINAGQLHGVRKDCAVISAEGVVGRVFATSSLGCEVELLTNSTAAAGALVGRSRFPGVVRGTGTERLQLDFVPTADMVKVGDAVVTSGMDRIYPKELSIGIVVSVRRAGFYQSIEVEPSVDFSRLEDVLVVLPDQ